MDTTYDIFVYGTLRAGGCYHASFLKGCPCLRTTRLPGFALYDHQGYYPFLVPAPGETVLGEVYRVTEDTKQALDELEDVHAGLYRFIWLPDQGYHTYVKANPNVGNMPKVPGGDWLRYERRKA